MIEPALGRRGLLTGAAFLLACPAWAAAPVSGRLRFSVFRKGVHVGEHEMTFTRAGSLVTARTEVSMTIRVGPAPVFRYGHQAHEQWRDGRFQALDTTTSSNGKREKVTARRAEGGVGIETLAGHVAAPATAAPLTHWNPEVFGGPLFNPQTGRMLKVTASRSGPASAVHWTIRGEAEIDDWYDEAGAWKALRGRLPDRSIMEYRRL